MYYVYVIRGITKKYYKGLTKNINRRLQEHNMGKTNSNKIYKPFTLVHVEICDTLREARSMERFFKTGYGREIIKEIAPGW